MRIREVRVFGLFDLFDHTITLNQTDRVTIVHGPNGYGKTAVLRLLRALFDCDYAYLEKTPFQRMELALASGERLRVEREPTETSTGPIVRLRVHFDRVSGEELVWYVPQSEPSIARWRARLFGSSETLQGDVPPPPPRPDWRDGFGLSGQFRASLVGTGRLHTSEGTVADTIAKELAATIAEQQAAHGRRAQELDRTFPMRLLQRGKSTVRSVDELRRDLDALEQKTQRLVAVGLLDVQAAVSTPVGAIDEEGREILSIFVADATEKLSVFDDLLARLELLHDVIGRRFSFKTMRTNAERGISFVSVRGKRVELDVLSSGEQHELILLYELLFRIAPGTLVLIDEPELSLHILWQNEFVDDLTRIVKLRDFDVLLATHSPDIIGKHWDLTVELKPPPGLSPHA